MHTHLCGGWGGRCAAHAWPGCARLRSAYPYKQHADNEWVEVLHEADPFGDEHYGMWMVYAPGSGIYFNLGKTIAFDEHVDAYVHFGVSKGDLNEQLSKAAAASGYDSIQFLAHLDVRSRHRGTAKLTTGLRTARRSYLPVPSLARARRIHALTADVCALTSRLTFRSTSTTSATRTTPESPDSTTWASRSSPHD